MIMNFMLVFQIIYTCNVNITINTIYAFGTDTLSEGNYNALNVLYI